MRAPTLTPWLWFAEEAEDAARHYVSILPDSRIERITHYPIEGPWGAAGRVATVEFTLAGRRVAALNGGEAMPHGHSVSLAFECDTQEEIDRVWAAFLAGGGKAEQCGWLRDRFGLAWQVLPRALGEMMGDPDSAAVARVMTAMQAMVKLDLAALETAFAGGSAGRV